MPRKVTKVFYVSDDGTEHADREAARAHDRINRLEQVLHDAIFHHHRGGGRKPVAELRSAARDFAQIIVNDWQAVRDAMAAPDTPDEDDWQAAAPVDPLNPPLPALAEPRDDFEATNDANEAPRPVNRVLDEERGYDGRCLYCGSKFIHTLDCRNHPRNRKDS